MSHRIQYIVVVVALLVIAGLVAWYVFSQGGAPVVSVPAAPVAPASNLPAVTTSSLGASIYQKTQNPLGDKVPELSPTANPVKDVYKNPFE